MTTVIFFLFGAYYLVLIALYIGWRRASATRESMSKSIVNDELITVVIAARNEEKAITSLLEDLSKQSLKNFAVIVVDDQSEDKTSVLVDDFVKNDHRFSLLRSSGTGKKQALTDGIRFAKGSIIVTTDADCRVSEYWLEGLCEHFLDNGVKMVFGGVRMKSFSLFSHLQSLEFLSLSGSGAAMAGLGLPVMCNGANLAFRKSTFTEVGGYEGNLHIPSGDDEFLMRKILRRYRHGVRFVPTRGSVVTTEANDDFHALIHQRIRWAGKWRVNQSVSSKILAFFILSVQLCIVFLPLFVLFKVLDFRTGVFLWFLKICLEFIFLSSIAKVFNVRWRWWPFLLLQFIYPVYVVLIGLFSNFRSFNWKGRKLKSLMVSRY